MILHHISQLGLFLGTLVFIVLFVTRSWLDLCVQLPQPGDRVTSGPGHGAGPVPAGSALLRSRVPQQAARCLRGLPEVRLPRHRHGRGQGRADHDDGVQQGPAVDRCKVDFPSFVGIRHRFNRWPFCLTGDVGTRYKLYEMLKALWTYSIFYFPTVIHFNIL